jgi:hypothetical protein
MTDQPYTTIGFSHPQPGLAQELAAVLGQGVFMQQSTEWSISLDRSRVNLGYVSGLLGDRGWEMFGVETRLQPNAMVPSQLQTNWYFKRQALTGSGAPSASAGMAAAGSSMGSGSMGGSSGTGSMASGSMGESSGMVDAPPAPMVDAAPPLSPSPADMPASSPEMAPQMAPPAATLAAPAFPAAPPGPEPAPTSGATPPPGPGGYTPPGV